MKVIKIQGVENKHVPYLYNKVMPIMRENRCGGLFEIQSGDVKINAWSDQVFGSIKKALEEFKIVFKEMEG